MCSNNEINIIIVVGLSSDIEIYDKFTDYSNLLLLLLI
jgi:hypothetical protein